MKGRVVGILVLVAHSRRGPGVAVRPPQERGDRDPADRKDRDREGTHRQREDRLPRERAGPEHPEGPQIRPRRGLRQGRLDRDGPRGGRERHRLPLALEPGGPRAVPHDPRQRLGQERDHIQFADRPLFLGHRLRRPRQTGNRPEAERDMVRVRFRKLLEDGHRQGEKWSDIGIAELYGKSPSPPPTPTSPTRE